MGRRSRRRADPAGRPLPRPPRVRGEAAEELARAELQPLEPGEIPRAIKVASAIAVVIAVSNLVALAAGVELTDLRNGRGETVKPKEPDPFGVIAFSAVMLVAAVFMWRRVYWAVLGFQALLAIAAIFGGLALMVASNLRGAVVSGGIMLAAGTLFYFLIRAMARIQMPERPNRLNGHG